MAAAAGAAEHVVVGSNNFGTCSRVYSLSFFELVIVYDCLSLTSCA